MGKLVTALALSLTVLPHLAQAVSFSVEAQLSHTELSALRPIEYEVRFPTIFSSIDLLTLDAFWVGDGLDGGEAIAFSDLAGFGTFPDSPTVFSRRLAFPASQGFDLTPFLDGVFDGMVFADTEDTTATFDRLVFTIDGEPTKPVPQASTLVLTLLGFALMGSLRFLTLSKLGQSLS